ncbi:MAG: hypothetical protein RIM72_14505 [Alphaproteobacteria bacterium]
MRLDQRIQDLVNARVRRILLVGETALPKSQFLAYRKLVLDEFGEQSFHKELRVLLDTQNGREWNGTGRDYSDRKGGLS